MDGREGGRGGPYHRTHRPFLHMNIHFIIIIVIIHHNPSSSSCIIISAIKLEWENNEFVRARLLLTKARERASSERVWLKAALLGGVHVLMRCSLKMRMRCSDQSYCLYHPHSHHHHNHTYHHYHHHIPWHRARAGRIHCGPTAARAGTAALSNLRQVLHDGRYGSTGGDDCNNLLSLSSICLSSLSLSSICLSSLSLPSICLSSSSLSSICLSSSSLSSICLSSLSLSSICLSSLSLSSICLSSLSPHCPLYACLLRHCPLYACLLQVKSVPMT
jgi:hypothetical protein